ncbi:unnamed protein product [Gordionus sp. m RMFG-2023]|uniref:elongation factor 1-gamma-like n=1 Tax=Gordionus sp. m RMFG-2023 TaxID=3053472 RepID=UPI0030DE3ADC
MDKSGILYTYEDNFRAYKIFIAANYSGAVVKQCSDFVFGETNKQPEFLKRFPLGKVPAFLTTSGLPIFESNAIAHYVADEKLTPKLHYQHSLMIQWIQFAENEFLPHISSWLFPYLGITLYNKQAEDLAIKETLKCLEVIENHLLYNTYLVGERITLADIVLSSYLVKPFKMILTPNYRNQFKNTLRWFNTLMQQTEFKKAIEPMVLCEKAPVIPAIKNQQKIDIPKQNISKEKPQKKQTKPKDEDEEDDDNIGLLEEKSAKDPFLDLPKGTFNLEEFKRVYSNNETSVSIPYFWENFDVENYSIWYCEYIYDEELKKDYMSCNLITGMYQRLDKMRKNAFASVVLSGQENNFVISGIWVWKGQDLAFKLSPDWQIDYESYKWKKLDARDESTKKLVNSYFSWEGDFLGKKFSQGKIFK